jgi:hypothetical protein
MPPRTSGEHIGPAGAPEARLLSSRSGARRVTIVSMLGVRGLIWSAAICAVITLFAQCRPTWSARRFIERQAAAGFEQAFTGHRFSGGDSVVGGTSVDPMLPTITTHAVEITAERIAWNGNRAEFVVRHRVELDGAPNATQDVHVQIEKRNGQWVYERFEVRGSGEMSEPNRDNPWARALREG